MEKKWDVMELAVNRRFVVVWSLKEWQSTDAQPKKPVVSYKTTSSGSTNAQKRLAKKRG
jgi:hypothetical protein